MEFEDWWEWTGLAKTGNEHGLLIDSGYERITKDDLLEIFNDMKEFFLGDVK